MKVAGSNADHESKGQCDLNLFARLHQLKAAAKIDLVWVEPVLRDRSPATSMDASPIDFSPGGNMPSGKSQQQSWQVLVDEFVA